MVSVKVDQETDVEPELELDTGRVRAMQIKDTDLQI